jgi:hypothetical protein
LAQKGAYTVPVSLFIPSCLHGICYYFFLQACLDVREAPAFWGKMQLIAENPLETDKVSGRTIDPRGNLQFCFVKFNFRDLPFLSCSGFLFAAPF